jgi:NhaA family Na+:H+ antiporter
LFIGSLAFEQTGVDRLFDERLGIIAGSLVSGMLGYLLLKWWLPRTATNQQGVSQ